MRRKQQIDPKTFRKQSRIAEKAKEEVQVAGERVRKDFGYGIAGASLKSFETEYMCLVQGASTPKWLHAKKVRVFRVLNGVGIAETFNEAGEPTIKPLSFGDEFIADKNVPHRIVAQTKLELFVVCEPKYEHALQELEAGPVASVSESSLSGISVEDKAHRAAVISGSVRRSSKAREQLAMSRNEPLPKDRNRGESGDPDKFFRNNSGGLNAMPVAGFDEEGAG